MRKLLLGKGADVNAQVVVDYRVQAAERGRGDTPLHLVVRKRHPGVVNLLFDARADVTIGWDYNVWCASRTTRR